MTDSTTTVLVTGASGFVGRRLTPTLVEAGHNVRAMTRRPDEYDGPGEPVFGDVSEPDSLDSADFEKRDAAAATAFGAKAAEHGVKQIVYLGGLGSDDQDLSAHLRSRREVEHLLADAGVPVTVLRAAIVVGDGGISWEITRQLVKRLPAMVVPRWASTLTQPIAIDDVVRYLSGVIGKEAALGKVFEIGGPDQLTYLEMLVKVARIEGRSIPIVSVPVLTPRLSSYWLALVTDIDVTTGRNLIDSMSNEVLVTDHSIQDIVPGELLSYDESVRRALAERG